MTLPVVTGRGWRGGAFAAGPAAPAAESGVTRQDDLVVWYKLDETAGSVVSDSSGNGRDATANNMADDDWITGKNGNALNFDHTDDFVKDDGASKDICNAMNGSATASSQGPWSVSFWLKKENNTAAGIFTIAGSAGIKTFDTKSIDSIIKISFLTSKYGPNSFECTNSHVSLYKFERICVF